jgi:hypothetical protein
MPKFSTYDATARVAGPISTQSASAADFGAGIGAGLQNVANAGQNLNVAILEKNKRDDNNALNVLRSQAMADLSAMQSDMETNAPLGAPGHVKNITEAVDSYYEQRQDTVSTSAGQQALTQQREQLKSAFAQSAIRFQAASKGAKAVSDFTTSVNNDAHTLSRNPDMFTMVLQANEAAINDPNGILARSMDAGKLKALQDQTTDELAIAAARGYINRDPFLAQEMLADGDFDKYLDVDQVKALDKEAELGIKAIESDQALADARAKDQKKAQDEVVKSDYLNRMQPGVENPLTNKDILSSNLSPADKVLYMNLLKNAGTAGRTVSDPGIYNALVQRIYLQDDDPNKISNEDDLNEFVASGKLSLNDAIALRAEINRDKKPENKIETKLMNALAKMAKAQLSKTNDFLNVRDPEGDKNYYNWYSTFLQEYQHQKDDGVSFYDLLTPGTKFYMGNGIETFQRSSSQVIGDMVKEPEVEYSPDRQSASVAIGEVTVLDTAIDTSKATRKFFDTENKVVYEIDGKFLYIDGKEYKKQ